MANLWCVDSEMSEIGVIIKISISDVLQYGQSHSDIHYPKGESMSSCLTMRTEILYLLQWMKF